MNDTREVICRPRWKGAWWFFAGLGAIATTAAVTLWAVSGAYAWLGTGLLSVPVGLLSLHRATARLHADARGLHVRTLLRHRSLPWSDVADLRVRLRNGNASRGEESRRVIAVLRDGRRRRLPLPLGWTSHDPDFDDTLDALRALHRRHGTPVSAHLPVVSHRTAGRGWAGSLALCVLLLAGAGLAARSVPDAGATERAWKSAVPCTDSTPAADRSECLTFLPAVIERTELNRSRHDSSLLYFTDARPVRRQGVSDEAALEFRPGDRVRLTLWRGEVRTVAGDRHVWHGHVPGAGETAVLAAVPALLAGYPAARVLIRLRGRHRPDDEVLPSALPFAAALTVTGLWLLPLCYFCFTVPLGRPAVLAWAAAGTPTSLALLAWAWRATRVRVPGAAGASGAAGAAGGPPAADDGEADDGEVFVRARFLEPTDYNPHRFGTHVVLGGGAPPAVTPHPGPGRYAARPIPVDRLTLRGVRRARGSDGDTVPVDWHVAELDDGGTPVRLAAAPADLARVLDRLT
ncbi:PH domain-containing protein [Streptomyces prasinosporus]|uniref:PH domain-containing protein n=1 Tax=Streptomyces prasinosporus TaxID=68256 RepID=A0ABP6U083_9ACTN